MPYPIVITIVFVQAWRVVWMIGAIMKLIEQYHVCRILRDADHYVRHERMATCNDYDTAIKALAYYLSGDVDGGEYCIEKTYKAVSGE